MLLKKKIVVLICVLCLLISSGCWDSLDINERSLLTLVLVDKEDEQFVFYIEVPNMALGGQGAESDGQGGYDIYSIIRAGGESYVHARESLDRKMEKPVFVGTTRTLILTQRLVEHSLEEYMYRLRADPEYRKALGIVTTSVNPDELFKLKPENNITLGYAIDDLIHALERQGQKITADVSNVLEYLASDTCFVIPDIGVVNDNLTFVGYTVIHEGKYLGYVPANESKGLVWLRGKNPQFSYVIPYEDADVSLRTTLKSKSIKPFHTNDGPIFDMSFKYDAEIMYLNKDMAIDEIGMDKIREEIQKALMDDILTAIDQSRNIQCDYLGLGDIFRIHYPNEFKSFDCCCEMISSAQIILSVEANVKPGSMLDFDV